MSLRKTLVILTGTALDFPECYPSTNRLKELGLALKHLEYTPVLIPLGASRTPDLPGKGIYHGLRYSYTFTYRNIIKTNSRPVNILIRRYYSIFSALILAVNIFKKRNRLLFVFSGTTSLLSIFILSLACGLCRVPFIYDVVENPAAVLRSRKISELSNKDKINFMLSALKVPFIYLFFWRLPAYLTCITQNQIDYLKKYNFKSRKLLLLPVVKFINGVGNPDFSEPGQLNYILYSGSLTFSKDGLDKVIRAIALLKKRGANTALKIFGYGKQKEIGLISNLIMDLNVTDLVKIEGFAEENKLREEQRKAFLLLLLKTDTPQNQYNLATKIIDYLQTGRPVLMSSLQTHREYFDDCDNALLVDGNDENKIADKILFAFNNPELAEKIGRRGTKLLYTRFNAVDNIKTLVRKVIEKT